MKDQGNKRVLDDFRKTLVEALKVEKNLPTVIAIITREIPGAMDNFEEKSKKEAAIMANASESLREAVQGMSSSAIDLSKSSASAKENVSVLKQEVSAAMQTLKERTQAIDNAVYHLQGTGDKVVDRINGCKQIYTNWSVKLFYFFLCCVLISLISTGTLLYFNQKKIQAAVDKVMSDRYLIGMYVQQAKPELWKQLADEYMEAQNVRSGKPAKSSQDKKNK